MYDAAICNTGGPVGADGANARGHPIIDMSRRFPEACPVPPPAPASLGRPPVEEPGVPNVDPNIVPQLWESQCGGPMQQFLSESDRARIRDLIARHNVVQIRGMPRDLEPPASPNDSASQFSDIPETLKSLFGIIDLMGCQCFSYAAENGGRVVRDIVARKRCHDELSSHGWGADLPWHMDGAFRPLNEEECLATGSLSPAPRWLVFGVIYGNSDIPITCVHIDDVIVRLPERHVDALARPNFNIQSTDSFEIKHVTHNVPILVPDSNGGYFSRYIQGKCDGVNDTANEALQAFADTLATIENTHIELMPGDIVVMDNFKSLHKRNAYTPRWDGKDRWLVRLYAAPLKQFYFPLTAATPRLWI